MPACDRRTVLSRVHRQRSPRYVYASRGKMVRKYCGGNSILSLRGFNITGRPPTKALAVPMPMVRFVWPTIDLRAVAYLGEGGGATAPFDLTLVNFCTVSVSFLSRLDRKIRAPRLLVTVRVFCLLNSVKMHPNLSFWGQKWFFSRRPIPSSTPHPSRHLRRPVLPLLKS